ncbi:MAG: hypothetical protein AB7S26_10975 [Sandaracinaceae bacterium]
MLGGGWLGYVYVFAGCAVVIAILLASTAGLYVYSRTRRGRATEPRVRVTSLGHDAGGDPEPPDVG